MAAFIVGYPQVLTFLQAQLALLIHQVRRLVVLLCSHHQSLAQAPKAAQARLKGLEPQGSSLRLLRPLRRFFQSKTYYLLCGWQALSDQGSL